MISPLTNVLLKIFVTGFFRAHSGMLIFLFGTLISYCFFINTLGHIPIWAFAEWNLAITLSLVTNPFILLVFFFICLGYSAKSVQYIATQLSLKQHEFLYYSCSSLTKFNQYKSWFNVQLNIFLPLWVYALFATIIGVSYGYYIIPSLILLFLFTLTAIDAFIYLRIINSTLNVNTPSLLLRLTTKWHKPFFLLYTFHVFNNNKLAYLVTKISSWIFMIGIVTLFSDLKHDPIIPTIIILFIITIHCVLIYNEYHFNETALYFSHNLPISKKMLFVGFSTNYLILMLPELLWLITKYQLIVTAGVFCFGLSLLLLYRSLPYFLGFDIKKFIVCVFLLFNVFFIAILYHYVWYLIAINLITGYTLFIKSYLNESLKF